MNIGDRRDDSLIICAMGRMARVVAAGVPHHVTQRGNGRRFILEGDAERAVYLSLLRQSLELHGVLLAGYCLMSNHVHLVAVPHTAAGLALALKQTHGRYASYWNAVQRSSGHVWQGRYYSCPLDQEHLWEALRYTELNPVRAGLCAKAEAWSWSSAAAHCGLEAAEAWLDVKSWAARWTFSAWREYLAAGETEVWVSAIRQCTHTGRPLGSAEFVHFLEQAEGRRLAPQKGGRPPTIRNDSRQRDLSFDS